MAPIFARPFVVSILALVLISGPALADDELPGLDETPHITMVGTAHADVAPDIATITLGVTTEKPNAADAANENAQKARAVVDAAKGEGIGAADIATQSLTLTRTFDEMVDANGRNIGQKPRGFAAENIVAIKVRNLSKAGPLAAAMIEKGANRLDGIAFGVEHPEPILEKLTGEAVRNARTLAQSAADAAGVRLGRVLLVDRPGNGEAPMRVAATRMKRATPMAGPVEPGTSTYETSIEVVWAIAPK